MRSSAMLKAATVGLVLVSASASVAKAEPAWPSLPVGVKNGIGVRVAETLYVGLGSAGTGLYALDLNNPGKGWVKRADFPGPATFGAPAAASNGRIYVFSGNGKARPTDASPIIFDTVYAYDASADRWSKVDTNTPAGLSGAKAVGSPDGRIVILGGYNKQLFDKYLADLSTIDKSKDPAGYDKVVSTYMGMSPVAYRWNPAILAYDPAANAWTSLGNVPDQATCDSSLVPEGSGSFLLLGGEVKPGLRTTRVSSVSISGVEVQWSALANLPQAQTDQRPEGVSGAFAGKIGDAVLVAGGANFPGARARGDAGRWYVNDGLTKVWRREIYVLQSGVWQEIGQLPVGLAYGVSFDLPGGVLLVGGEDKEGNAHREVSLLKWDGKTIDEER